MKYKARITVMSDALIVKRKGKSRAYHVEKMTSQTVKRWWEIIEQCKQKPDGQTVTIGLDLVGDPVGKQGIK